MIIVDDREHELVKWVRDPVVVRLEYGDACIQGQGPDGKKVEVGIERKGIHDLINSILTGRLSGHQLPGLMENYDIVYLIVEGDWRGAHEGGHSLLVKNAGGKWREVDRGRRIITVRDVWTYLTTLETICGLRIRTASTVRETAGAINNLEYWWNKRWEDHRGHMAMHKQHPIGGMRFWKPSLVARVAAELPGIGMGRAMAVEKRFRSVEEMMRASEEEWREVEGIGRVVARNVWEAIRHDGGTCGTTEVGV